MMDLQITERFREPGSMAVQVRCKQCGRLGSPAYCYNDALAKALAAGWITIKGEHPVPPPVLVEPNPPPKPEPIETMEDYVFLAEEGHMRSIGKQSLQQRLWQKIAERRVHFYPFNLAVTTVDCQPHDVSAVCFQCKGQLGQ